MEESNAHNSRESKNKLELRNEIFSDSEQSSLVLDASLLPIKIKENKPEYINSSVVHHKYYNNFNFSKLATKYQSLNVALGITSAKSGEGKTLVASNMAVSLAQAYQQRTVLVDLNVQNPQLHDIFGVSLYPGLLEALHDKMLKLSPTSVNNLFLLPAGDSNNYELGIKDTIALREILYTLKSEFDFVIVDMSSVFPLENFPIHFINEMDGLIAVVDTQRTRQEHLREVFKQVGEQRVVGYILNKMKN